MLGYSSTPNSVLNIDIRYILDTWIIIYYQRISKDECNRTENRKSFEIQANRLKRP